MEEWGTIITTITTIPPFPTNQRSVAGGDVSSCLAVSGSEFLRKIFGANWSVRVRQFGVLGLGLRICGFSV